MKLSVTKNHDINEDENTVIDYDNLVSNISRFSIVRIRLMNLIFQIHLSCENENSHEIFAQKKKRNSTDKMVL